MGYCRDGWWLNQQFCCWEIEEDEDVACTSWTPWSEYSAARWMIYVSCAVSGLPLRTGDNFDPVLGISRFYSITSCSQHGQECCGLRYIGDQVHPGRCRNA
jgi:hypothetical protein